MLRKLGIGLVVVAAIAVIGHLQGKELDAGHPLRDSFMKNGANMALSFLKTALIQRELNLSDEQIEKLAPLKMEFKTKSRNLYVENPNLSREEGIKKIGPLRLEYAQKLEEILKPEQIDRLLEIIVQCAGPILFTDDGFDKFFGLSEEQKGKIKSIVDIAREPESELRREFPTQMSNEDITRAKKESIKKLISNLTIANEQLNNVLTSEQRKSFAKMKGKKIDADKLIDVLVESLFEGE